MLKRQAVSPSITSKELEQLLGRVFSRALSKALKEQWSEGDQTLLNLGKVQGAIRRYIYADQQPQPGELDGIGIALWSILHEMLYVLVLPPETMRGRRSKREIPDTYRRELVKNHQLLLEAHETRNAEMWLAGESTLKMVMNPYKHSWPRFIWHRGELEVLGWDYQQKDLDRVVNEAAQRLKVSFKDALTEILSEFEMPYESYRYLIRSTPPPRERKETPMSKLME